MAKCEQATKTAPSFEPSITASERRFGLESFNRIYNIRLIGCTINLTSDLYGKVKESNAAANFLLLSAEQSVHAAVSLAEPVLITLQKPLKVTDSLICNTMDKFVECNAIMAKETQRKVTKVIANLPLQSAINCAKAVSSYSAEKVGHFVTQIKHQSQIKDEEECSDETTLPEGEPRKQDIGTQTGQTENTVGNVRDKIEYFSKML